jgi:hypothetical protein
LPPENGVEGMVKGPALLKATDTNIGIVEDGNDGLNDASVGNGLRLAAGEEVYFELVENLGMLFVDAAVNGEGVC